MPLWLNSNGKLVENDAGTALVECENCPCDDEGDCIPFDWELWDEGPWNTGIDDDHVPLSGATCGTDTHWGGRPVPADAEVGFNGWYAGDSLTGGTDGRFIAVTCDTMAAPGVVTTFAMDFDVPATVDETTLMIRVDVAPDNWVTAIKVNGVDQGTGRFGVHFGAARDYHTVTLPGPFSAGTNTIEVLVENDVEDIPPGEPHGLMVAFRCWIGELLP